MSAAGGASPTRDAVLKKLSIIEKKVLKVNQLMGRIASKNEAITSELLALKELLSEESSSDDSDESAGESGDATTLLQSSFGRLTLTPEGGTVSDEPPPLGLASPDEEKTRTLNSQQEMSHRVSKVAGVKFTQGRLNRYSFASFVRKFDNAFNMTDEDIRSCWELFKAKKAEEAAEEAAEKAAEAAEEAAEAAEEAAAMVAPSAAAAASPIFTMADLQAMVTHAVQAQAGGGKGKKSGKK